MKRKYVTSLFILAAVFTLSASTYNLPSPPKLSPPPEEGFKNLKVLPKDISEEELDSLMGMFSISLGVRCNFCHAANADTSKHRLDFASDSKEMKNTARKMISMTAYLNKNFFNDEHSNKKENIHKVICYTCHRGTKEPDSDVFLSIIDSTMQSHRNRH